MRKRRLSNEEIASLCLSLSMMLHAGISSADGLALMAEDEPDKFIKGLLTEMSVAADSGESLADVFRQSGVFPDYVCSLLAVGKESGRMEEALNALSQHYETQASLGRKLRAALLYPAILLLIMLVVIFILLVYVLPIFNDVYAQLGSSLSGIAGGLLYLGELLGKAMPVLGAVLGILLLFIIAFAMSGDFRDKVIGRYRTLRGDKGLLGELNTARFAGALSMGISSGLRPEAAIQLSARILSDIPAFQDLCEDCIARIDRGESLSSAMSATGLLPKAECRLLEIGLKAGVGDVAMQQIARKLAEDGDYAIELRASQIEPVMVIATSSLVGFILLAVMVPLIQIMAVIG